MASAETTNPQKSFFIELKCPSVEDGRSKQFQLKATVIKHHAEVDSDSLARQCGWVKYSLLPKIFKWMTSTENEKQDQAKCEFENVGSLTQLNLEAYIELYNELKVKYGEHMVKVNTQKY